MSWKVKTDRSKIKVLVVFANPRNTVPLRLGSEDRVIHEAIQLSPHRDRISITVHHAATIHDLRRALLTDGFQIVHISGHGNEAGLVLEDEVGKGVVIPQVALADLFQAYCPLLKCVILNSCYSISQGQLTSLGVPFTIAMESSISDKAAIEFSRGFYDAIGAGRTIDFAYDEGCRTVKLVAPDSLFASQLLVKDQNLKHFQLGDDEELPLGYISIWLDKRRIAFKPTFYQSLQALLDDLYVGYLTNQFKPYTYGSSWILASQNSFTEPRRLLVPWSWLLKANRNKSITTFESVWDLLPPKAYGLVSGTYWIIARPPFYQVFGLATNIKGIGKRIYSMNKIVSSTDYKILQFLFRGVPPPGPNAGETKRVPITLVNPKDYEFLFVFFTESNLLSGRAINNKALLFD